MTDVAAHGDVTTLTACDEGDATVDPGTTPQAVLVTVLLRNTLLAQGAEQVGVDSASCVVDQTLDDASFRPLLDATVADPSAPAPRRGVGTVQSGRDGGVPRVPRPLDRGRTGGVFAPLIA